MAFSPRYIVGCLLKKGLQRGGHVHPRTPLATPLTLGEGGGGRYFSVTKTCTAHGPFEVNEIVTNMKTNTQFLSRISIFAVTVKKVRFCF